MIRNSISRQIARIAKRLAMDLPPFDHASEVRGLHRTGNFFEFLEPRVLLSCDTSQYVGPLYYADDVPVCSAAVEEIHDTSLLVVETGNELTQAEDLHSDFLAPNASLISPTIGVVRFNPNRGGLDWLLDTEDDGFLPERIIEFGLAGDIPVPGDYNGDGVTDAAVVRPNPTRGGLDWLIDLNGDGFLPEQTIEFGLVGFGHIPVPGDYNGDGITDAAVVAPNTARGGLDWLIDLNNDGEFAEQTIEFGLVGFGHIPVPGDYNGDGITDAAVVAPNDTRGGLDWLIDLNNDGEFAERTIEFGLVGVGDIPVVGDWNADGSDEVGVVRPNPTRGGLDWLLDANDDGFLPERTIEYGLVGFGDIPVVGQFNEGLRGDLNGDLFVNAADLNRLALNWQKPVTGGLVDADINGNGIVDAGDLNAIALNWQATLFNLNLPEFTVSNYQVVEGMGREQVALFTVERDGPLDESVVVHAVTEDGVGIRRDRL